jgi:hypothetical protein
MCADIRVGAGGAVYVQAGAPSFSNCNFIGNAARGAFCCHVDIDERVLTFKQPPFMMVVVLSMSKLVLQAFRSASSPATLLVVRSAGMSTSMDFSNIE